MKICIISDEHFPHTGADTVVIMNTAAALAAAGAHVELVVPHLWEGHRTAAEVLDHYGVEQSFRLTRLPSAPRPRRSLRPEKLLHGLLSPAYAAMKRADLVHTRDFLPIMVAHTTGIPWSLETYRRYAEESPWLPTLTRRIGLARAVGAVAHSRPSADDLVRLGFAPDAVVVARPGFAFEQFEPPLSKEEARRAVGLETRRQVVGYAGNVGSSKGTDELVDVAAAMPDLDFLVVGGTPDAVADLRAKLRAARADNVTLVGHQPPGRVAPFLFASDVLFVPAITHNALPGLLGRVPLFHRLPGTPLKIYGYMASGRPIVSADQAHTRDLLTHEHNALLVAPRDTDATVAAIRRLLGNPALSARLTATAKAEVETHTWENRGRDMLAFFERRLRTR